MIGIDDIVNSKDFLKSIQQLDDINVKIGKMGGYCSHNHHHILYIIKELLGKECKNYLEIGVALGSSMSSVIQSDSPMKCFYGVDLFEIETGSENLNKVYEILQSFNKHNHDIKLIKGNSKSKNVIDAVNENLNGEGVDFFYIDGSHTHQDVIDDFWNYEKLVNSDGVVVFDDGRYVNRAINELVGATKETYMHLGWLPGDAYKEYHEEEPSHYCKYRYNDAGDQVLTKGNTNWQFIMVKK